MQVGDLVKHFLTEQIGIIIKIGTTVGRPTQVLWTTQGESLFGPGHKEWCDQRSLEVLSEVS